MIALLLACSAEITVDPAACDAEALAAGQVRARRIPCSDELIDGGEGRRSDYLIENAVARFVIRQGSDALTRLGLAGGTVVDAATVGGQDTLIEAVPTPWFTAAELAVWQEEDAAGITVTGTRADGTSATVTYPLPADSVALRIDGIDGLEVLPRAGAERVGAALEVSGALLAATGAVSDRGGQVDYAGASSLMVGTREAVHEALWPAGEQVSGAAEGDWVVALGDEVLARYPVEGGAFTGWLPPQADGLQAIAEGHAPGEVDADPLVPGAAGWLRLRATDGSGQTLPVTVQWQEQLLPALPGETVPTGPGSGEVVLYAGPGRELHRADLTIDGEVSLSAVLPLVVTEALLVDLGRVTSPDTSERRTAEAVLTEAAAAGVGFAVMVATDEISGGTADALPGWLPARVGSRSAGIGEPVAWSWSASADRPAHGAADWSDLSATDLLAVMARRDDRITLVTLDWFAAAGSSLDWLPPPDLVAISSLDDLPALAALYDAGQPMPPVGPLTWVEGVDPAAYSAVDAEAMLLDGRTIATSGPRIVLEVEGEGPGSVVAVRGAATATLRVEAPSWMPLTGAALIGPGGQTLASWQLDGELPVQLEHTLRNPPPWVLAICWGEDAAEPWLLEPAWALTGPIWTERH